ncbi:putative sugar kinase [Caldisphaera lagunensis DSM 15908]|uniref:Beta-ribofuranosylaminobenzene 5'-phosphate synthase n=1 Tax=Caldisphaera lagunensis (strain DSM 15908 / JCM 11604 / ANMR 0165 / IC-154) TaxID=1056495 RepID=L0A8H0_CALLD|nr:sugar kinase [Caldisphaera lagunensis]AFZ70158.1 putative sugar kinase [Caldisphaera lagunensis DSM 15908]
MPEKVFVETGSRLHAGFYYAGNEWNVKWGSAGFYIKDPSFIAEFSYGQNEFIGPDFIKKKVERISELLKINNYRVKVLSYIPEHIGLGSGTQIELAIINAFKKLFNLNVNINEIINEMNIAKYSGTGYLLFYNGGFVADAGRPENGEPKVLIHHNIPEKWRFVYVTPDLKKGLDYNQEEKILKNPWEPSEGVKRLMSYGLLRLASGIAREDIEDALEGLRMIQEGTGLYFSKTQGGSYREDLSKIVSELWRSRMIVAQSSWGPTLYTISREDEAEGDADLIKSVLHELRINGKVYITQPRNIGFTIY